MKKIANILILATAFVSVATGLHAWGSSSNTSNPASASNVKSASQSNQFNQTGQFNQNPNSSHQGSYSNYSHSTQNAQGNQAQGLDEQIANKIRPAVPETVNISVNGGIVTLAGSVNSDIEKTRVEALAKRTDGVNNVVNKIKVTK